MKYLWCWVAGLALIALASVARGGRGDSTPQLPEFRGVTGAAVILQRTVGATTPGQSRQAPSTGAFDGTVMSSADVGIGSRICSVILGGGGTCSAGNGELCSSAFGQHFCSSASAGDEPFCSAVSGGDRAICSAAGEGTCSADIPEPSTAQCSAAFIATCSSTPKSGGLCSAFAAGTACSAIHESGGECSTPTAPCSATFENNPLCSAAVGGICSVIFVGSPRGADPCVQ